ncbi:UNVERIFIED_ORG: phosphoserine phosphatase [Idiomarina abyssalis]|uniref:phosphoserine phosphatase SerB n=1 Tax=unclassified Idiomarina TaxID=2614829 RepID=UPI000C5A6797|nr:MULTISPECIES: phosphoserine phosphatase SerB [unclassified Idiomarina]MAA61827.1 phosphoserine phosphatase SerB [Idiomarina sp.]TDO49585.1 phosphoserine phosphatase [Idiomarina sp. 017G]|tara:strand:- start:30899 stop:31561 length:663 start_codon:yes stop_codon:yes gene_type:complete
MKHSSGLIVFDMDSTLIHIECIDEIARLNNRYTKVSAITEAAMRGEIDFAESLTQRVACLEGIKESALESLFSPIPFNPGAKELIQALQAAGWKTALVSGGFTWFANRVQAALNLDAVIANQLEVADGCLTGKVLGDIVDAKVKAEQLQQLAGHWNIPSDRTVAVGDGANDAVMLKAAAVGIAFNAKPALQAIADYSVNSNNLLEILGCLKQSELIEPVI